MAMWSSLHSRRSEPYRRRSRRQKHKQFTGGGDGLLENKIFGICSEIEAFQRIWTEMNMAGGNSYLTWARWTLRAGWIAGRYRTVSIVEMRHYVSRYFSQEFNTCHIFQALLWSKHLQSLWYHADGLFVLSIVKKACECRCDACFLPRYQRFQEQTQTDVANNWVFL